MSPTATQTYYLCPQAVFSQRTIFILLLAYGPPPDTLLIAYLKRSLLCLHSALLTPLVYFFTILMPAEVIGFTTSVLCLECKPSFCHVLFYLCTSCGLQAIGGTESVRVGNGDETITTFVVSTVCKLQEPSEQQIKITTDVLCQWNKVERQSDTPDVLIWLQSVCMSTHTHMCVHIYHIHNTLIHTLNFDL